MADSLQDLTDKVQDVNEYLSKTAEELNRLTATLDSQVEQMEQKDDNKDEEDTDTFVANTQLINDQDIIDFTKQIEANFDMSQIRGLFNSLSDNNIANKTDPDDTKLEPQLDINNNENEQDFDDNFENFDMKKLFMQNIQQNDIITVNTEHKQEDEYNEIEALEQMEFMEKSAIKYIELPKQKCTLNYMILNEKYLNENNSNTFYPLLLIHGLCDSLKTWHLLLPKLISYENIIISVSLRGFGDSNKYNMNSNFSINEYLNDLIELLNELKIEKAIWIGHDLGSFIVQKAGIEYGELVHKMVLISPNYTLSNCDKLMDYKTLKNVLIKEKLENVNGVKEFVNDMINDGEKYWNDGDMIGKIMKSMINNNFLDDLKYIKCQCYILIGSNDKIFDKKYGYTMQKCIKSSFITEFPNMNHYLIWNKSIISRLGIIIWDFCRQ